MGKVKQWAENTAEKAVDTIIDKLKNKVINVETAKNEILKVDNVALCSIDEFNIDEVIEEATKQKVYDPNGLPKDFTDRYHIWKKEINLKEN